MNNMEAAEKMSELAEEVKDVCPVSATIIGLVAGITMGFGQDTLLPILSSAQLHGEMARRILEEMHE